MRVLRGLVATIGVVLLVAGVAVAVAIGPDNTWAGDQQSLDGDPRLVVTAPTLLNVAGVDLTVTAESSAGETFIGAGNPVHVDDYTKDVARAEITALGRDGVEATTWREGRREQPAAAPTGLDFWEHSISGPGEQRLVIPLESDAALQVAAMPAGTAEASTSVGLGYTLSGTFPAALVAAALGLLMVVGAVLLGRRARRKAQGVPPDGDTATMTGLATSTQPREPAEGPAQSQASTHPSASPLIRTTASESPMTRMPRSPRIATTGAVAALTMAISGCSLPTTVDHGQPQVAPMSEESAKAVFAHYNEVNNAAIRGASSGDLDAWKVPDTGIALAQDRFGTARQGALDELREPEEDYLFTPGGVYAPLAQEYPMWALVEGASGQDSVRGIRLMRRERAADPWRLYSSARVVDGADALAPAPPDDATPTNDQQARVKDVDAALRSWIDSGEPGDVAIPEDVSALREDLVEKSRVVRSMELSTQPWSARDDDEVPSTYAVRTADGVMMHSSYRVSVRAHAQPGRSLKWLDKELLPLRQRSDGRTLTRFVGITLTALIPESGEPRVIASHESEVSHQPNF